MAEKKEGKVMYFMDFPCPHIFVSFPSLNANKRRNEKEKKKCVFFGPHIIVRDAVKNVLADSFR